MQRSPSLLWMDERTERINGQISFFCLVLTQIALAGVIFYKRYVLGLPQEEYIELDWIVCLSMGGYWVARLYLSGILPVISFKGMLVVYVAFVAIIAIPTAMMHGFPPPERWYEGLYVVVGPALILGFYALVAYLGKRRLEKYIPKE